MKRLLSLAIIAFTALVAITHVANAAVVNSSFDVTVSLDAKCVATNDGLTTVDFGSYDAISGGASIPTPSVALTFDCTRGLAAPTVAFDAVFGTAIGGGVLAGLNYDLNASAAVITGSSAATSAPGGVGTAAIYTYTISGTMAANQAGTCGVGGVAACVGTHTRTLIVTY